MQMPDQIANHHGLKPDRIQIERRLIKGLAKIVTSRGLTLLIGPAGSGKSTILNQLAKFIDADGGRVAVYRPPLGHADPTAEDFERWLLQVRADAVTRSSPMNAPSAQASQLVIIDEYDRLDTEDMNAAIRKVIGDSEGIHVVVATRKKVNLKISDLCVGGLAFVLEGAELFFSEEEVSELIKERLAHKQIDKIYTSTHGWPALIGIVSERIGRKPVGGKFTLLNADIFDYIEEQLFLPLPQEARALLLDVSQLDTVNPALVDHVRNRSDSAYLLQELTKTLGGLVERQSSTDLDSFRLNPVLREYLHGSSHLLSAKRDEISLKAIAWYKQNLLFEHAIAQSRTSGIPGLFEETLDDIYVWRIFAHRGVSGLLSILKTLLPEEVSARPRLRLIAALTRFRAGYYVECNRILQEIKRETHNLSYDPFGNSFALQRDGALLEAYIAIALQGVRIDESLFDRISEAADRDDALALGTMENLRCVVFEMRGDLPKAMEAWRRCTALFRGTMNAQFSEGWLPYHLPLMEIARGSFRNASEYTAKLARDDEWPTAEDGPPEAMTKIISAAASYERRFVEDASTQVREALDLLGWGSSWFSLGAIAYPIMFEVAHRTGGRTAVSDLAADLKRQVGALGIIDLRELVDALEVAWLLRAGERNGIARLVKRIELSLSREGYSPWRLHDAQMTALFHWSLAHGDSERALCHARTLIETGTRGGRLRTAAKGHVMSALALNRAGDVEGAGKAMEVALGMTASEQLVALFAEEGDLVSGIVADVAANNATLAISRRHATLVMRAIPLSKRQVAGLNARETEIALALVEGHSNKVIARKLGLTENTIKFHLKSMFAKLGVSDRRAAALAVQESMND
jgi:LuxR family maltose regulon positive regulatory protein